MNTNSIFGIMDILILGAGVYILFSWYELMFKNKIREGVVVPQGKGNHCKDLPGFQKAIGTKLLIFSLSAVLTGVLGVISDYVIKIPGTIYLIFTGLFFVVLIWYIVQSKKAINEYFY